MTKKKLAAKKAAPKKKFHKTEGIVPFIERNAKASYRPGSMNRKDVEEMMAEASRIPKKRISVSSKEAALLEHLRKGNNGNVLNILNEMENQHGIKYQMRIEHEGAGAKFDMSAANVDKAETFGIRHETAIKDVDFERPTINPTEDVPAFGKIFRRFNAINGCLHNNVQDIASKASDLMQPEEPLFASPPEAKESPLKSHWEAMHICLDKLDRLNDALSNINKHLHKIL